MQVRSFPVREHGRWVWIWLGSKELAEESLPPPIPWFTDANFLQVRGYTELACNYMLLQENVLDLTHLPFVHADAGQDGWLGRSSEVRVEDRRVSFTKTIKGESIAPTLIAMMGIEAGKLMNRTDWGTFASPACHYAGSDYEDPDPAVDGTRHYVIRTLHCATPISPDRCHYWWAFAQDFAQGQSNEALERFLAHVVDQDKRVLEAIQLNIDAQVPAEAAAEILVASDRVVVEARRVLRGMLAAERRQF